jgi:lysyl-tRNA synthetase class 1
MIGRGSWIDKLAADALKYKKRMGKKTEIFRTESGLGASGFPHIGSFSDAARGFVIKLAAEDAGHKSEFIAYSDDMDGLRKVPVGMPNAEELKKYIGMPVTDIPDPFKCHDSYGVHMSSMLIDSLDTCGIDYTAKSAREMYQKGTFTKQIELILANAEKVGEIVKELTGQEKYTEVLPYYAICENCGKMYTTHALEFHPETHSVFYKCTGMEIRGKFVEGCNHEGFADYTKDQGKLNWKVEFAARWDALGIDFEAYGKDIHDSVVVNDQIQKEILQTAPPYHERYEMFLDKGGTKISKSLGNVLTPQVWLRYGSCKSLMLLMLKRFQGTRSVGIEDIPKLMDEYDFLEDIYFGVRKEKNEAKKIKNIALYEYVNLLKPPENRPMHVPYNILINLVSVAPETAIDEFLMTKLEELGYSKDGNKGLKERFQFAKNWVEDFKEIEVEPVALSINEKNAIQDLIAILEENESSEVIQQAIFETARNNSLKPRNFFRLLYRILLGTDSGPKLGPYIAIAGPKKVAERLNLLRVKKILSD